MKKNAETAAMLIQQAIRETGNDFALSGARGYLVAALNELNHVHKKREKRENNYKMEQEMAEKRRLKIEDAKWRLKVLDDMLKEEQTKYNGLKRSDSQET